MTRKNIINTKHFLKELVILRVINNLCFMKTIKSILILLVGVLSLSSCSSTYTNAEDLVREDGIFVLDGEAFEGTAVSMTSKNRVRELVEFEDGKPVEMYEHSVDEGQFKEIKLENGTTTLISDLIVYSIDSDYETSYYSDGSVRYRTEIVIEDNDITTFEENGKKEYFDENGDLVGTDYYEKGELVKSERKED